MPWVSPHYQPTFSEADLAFARDVVRKVKQPTRSLSASTTRLAAGLRAGFIEPGGRPQSRHARKCCAQMA